MKGLHYFRDQLSRWQRIKIFTSWALCNFLWAIGAFVLEVWKPIAYCKTWALEVWTAALAPEPVNAPTVPIREPGWVLREYYERWGES